MNTLANSPFSVLKFEELYADLVKLILQTGEDKEGRNGITRSIFDTALHIDMSEMNFFPLLTGRKMYPHGILGELAAILRGPKHVDDFKKFGCNYWGQWADADGSLRVDYGNAWIDYNGVNQLRELVEKLKTNPNDRRLIINSWRPDRLDELSLPCCHYNYQWYVRRGKYLDMRWEQRSADFMIGVPSDIVLAAALNIIIANEVGLKPGRINMHFGDSHIYEEHFKDAEEYLSRVFRKVNPLPPTYALLSVPGQTTEEFLPEHINIHSYNPLGPIKFLLKE